KGDGNGSYWIQTIYSKHGIINWSQKFKVTVPVSMDLHNFPFDQQVVRVTVASGGSETWGTDFCILVDYSAKEMVEKYSKRVQMAEWELMKPAEVFEVRPLVLIAVAY